jgi:hypothetical protein
VSVGHFGRFRLCLTREDDGVFMRFNFSGFGALTSTRNGSSIVSVVFHLFRPGSSQFLSFLNSICLFILKLLYDNTTTYCRKVV